MTSMLCRTKVSGNEAFLTWKGMELFWESDEPFSPQTNDWALFAAVPYALWHGRDLEISGVVSRSALFNASHLAHYWCQRLPHRFKPISITAEKICGDVRQGRGVSLCYSGGVDANFALFQACSSEAVPRPDELLFIHGFDYSLDDPNYELALHQMRGEVELPVRRVKTNWRENLGQDAFVFFFTSGLATILHLSGARDGLFAADLDFLADHVIEPWGSNAVVNRMLGGGSTNVIPIGEGHTRIEKMAQLASLDWLKRLKVCYQKRASAENCGRCGKCQRTMLQLRAIGIDPTPIFGRDVNWRDAWNLNLIDAAERHFAHSTLQVMPPSTIRTAFATKTYVTHSYMKIRKLLRPLRRLLAKPYG